MSLPRYPAYKDSGVAWLGEVPGHWQPMKLKRLAKIQNGKDYKHIETVGEGYPVIGSGGEFANASEYLFEGESVLLGRKGTIDRPLYINGAFWVVDTMFYTKIASSAVAKYVYYCALTIKFDLYSTNTAVPSMTQEDLGNIVFAVPIFEEQTAIAAFLDRETGKIDALVAEQQKLIALLKEKRQAVISHAVTKGLNHAAPMKDSGIEWLGEVPEHWVVQSIKWLSPVQRGASPRPIDDPKFFDDEGEYAWVRIADVSASDGELRETTQRLSELGSSLSVKIHPGELFISIAGTVGKPCISATKACIHDGFVYFPTLKIPPMFLYRIFEAGVCYGGLGKFGTQLNLNTDTIGSIRIALPPASELEEILFFLDSETAKLDALTAEAQRGIALLKERRSALISAAVTGKIDVRGMAALPQ